MSESAPTLRLRRYCGSCGAEIIWVRTSTGRPMPVEVETANEGDETYEPGRHVSHFAHCPQADQWRKKR
jgi:hypothetical protein